MRASRQNLSLKLLIILLVFLTAVYLSLISNERWGSITTDDEENAAGPGDGIAVRKSENVTLTTSPNWVEINAIKIPKSEGHVTHEGMKKKKLFVIIVAGFRTGSTLLGEFFNKNDNIFYIFEPLHQTILGGHRTEIPGVTSSSSLSELQKLYLHNLLHSCAIFTYTEFRDQMLKMRCTTDEQSYYSHGGCDKLPADFMSKLCQNSATVVVKTIRIRDIRTLGEIAEIGGHDVKVVHLLRDPRAVVNSRKEFPYFYLNDLEELPVAPLNKRKIGRAAHDYCDHEYQNILFVESMPEWLRGNYLQVTHTQISTDPVTSLEKMYSFLKLDIPDNVRVWAESLSDTVQSEEGYLTTRKNSTEVMGKWRRELNSHFVRIIESVCRDLMGKLRISMM